MFDAIILGIIQGLTEFLPISSSAHIRIAGEFLGSAKDPGARFTAITQIGTELAVLIFFRKDIAKIETSPVSLMPPGLLNTCHPEDVADFVAWLTSGLK